MRISGLVKKSRSRLHLWNVPHSRKAYSGGISPIVVYHGSLCHERCPTVGGVPTWHNVGTYVCIYCSSNKPVPTRYILSKRRDTENCTKSVLQSRNLSLLTYITIYYRLYIQIRGTAVAIAIALFSALNSRLYVRRLVSASFVFTTSISILLLSYFYVSISSTSLYLLFSV